MMSEVSNSYAAVAGASPAFVKLIASEVEAVHSAQQAIDSVEIQLSHECADKKIQFRDVVQGNLSKYRIDDVIKAQGLAVDLDHAKRNKQRAQRALDAACQSAIADPVVKSEIADALRDVCASLEAAVVVVDDSLTAIAALESGLTASKQVADELRVARQGFQRLLTDVSGTDAAPAKVLARARNLADALSGDAVGVGA